MLGKHIQGRQESIDSASSLNSGDDRVSVNGNFVGLEGIRLKVSKRMQYMAVPVPGQGR